MRSLLPPLALSSLLVLSAACGQELASSSSCNDPGGSSMCPGDDCLSCHSFKAAGTVFAADGTTPVGAAAVTLVDKNGVTVSRTTNPVGNFYTTSALTFPLQRVTVSKGGGSVQMTNVGAGGCNGCHDAGFRIHLP